MAQDLGPDGLTAGQVAERRAAGQSNELPARSSRSLSAIVRANVLTWFNGLIGTLFAIMLVAGPIQDALFGFVIVANALIGIVQELRAKRTLDSLAIVGEARPTVRRDGADQQVAAAEIVLGDLVLLAAGDKIPVDGPAVSAEALEVDESLLTGEADPVVKRPGEELLSGSFVVAGHGTMRAARVGAAAHAAELVAESLGLPGAEHPVDARTLPAEPHELGGVVGENSVFGRVTPRQKQQMVASLQAGGHTVAMTGDGVNDVLALKTADIGVAMGAGSGAARAVAQIVLLDESFATLPEVVAEGRRVVGNIERVSNLFLVKSFESFLMVVLTGIARLPYPFLPRHTTLVGALTIGTPAFFLALAPNTARARPGFVRRVLRFTVPAGLISGTASFVSYTLARVEPGAQLQTEQTAAMVTLFTVSLWVLTLVARPLLWWKCLLVAAMAAGFLLVALLPLGRRIFDLQFGGWDQVGTSLAVAGCAGAALELLWRWAAPRAE
ncbi:MAG TPA: HAD-IC family P-type ATPase [Actinocrinis sp.]|nr:HAD-IC family P-type ATPase [Actinocrinis sp.]